jgi:SNF2 family DNA or RNA helicase
MRNDKRQESLEKIKTDPKIKVILISFKSGSTGQSLTIIVQALSQADHCRSQSHRL